LESDSPDMADTVLFSSLNQLIGEISLQIEKAKTTEINESPPPNIEELPEENSPEAKNFKSVIQAAIQAASKVVIQVAIQVVSKAAS
jgi:hypothetical protein